MMMLLMMVMIMMMLQADHERAERQRQYLAGLSEEAEYESSEATSLATVSTMEGEHSLVREEEDSASTTPREECLSPDTPTPTHHINNSSLNSSDNVADTSSDNNIEQLKMQLKEVRNHI